MKNLIFCLAFLASAFGAMAQSNAGKTPAQAATEKMTLLYGLTPVQQTEMLKIQERKFRNLAEIEPLKVSDPSGYILKIRSIQLGNNASFERLLDAKQLDTYKQEHLKLRERKAVAYKELLTAGTAQSEIEKKMVAYDLEAL